MISIALIIPTTPITAALSERELLCDKALTQVRVELTDLKALASAQKEYSDLLKNQRDDAFNILEKQTPAMPWYFWTILGGAAMATAIELRK